MNRSVGKDDGISRDELAKARKLLKEKGSIRDDSRQSWMTEQKRDAEEYLLGRRVDKDFEREDDQAKRESAAASFMSDKDVVTHNTKLELKVKMREDPLFAIKKRHEDARKQLLQNPVKMKEIQKAMEKEKRAKEDRDKKKKKKRNRARAEELLLMYRKVVQRSMAMKERSQREHRGSTSPGHREYRREGSSSPREDVQRARRDGPGPGSREYRRGGSSSPRGDVGRNEDRNRRDREEKCDERRLRRSPRLDKGHSRSSRSRSPHKNNARQAQPSSYHRRKEERHGHSPHRNPPRGADRLNSPTSKNSKYEDHRHTHKQLSPHRAKRGAPAEGHRNRSYDRAENRGSEEENRLNYNREYHRDVDSRKRRRREDSSEREINKPAGHRGRQGMDPQRQHNVRRREHSMDRDDERRGRSDMSHSKKQVVRESRDNIRRDRHRSGSSVRGSDKRTRSEQEDRGQNKRAQEDRGQSKRVHDSKRASHSRSSSSSSSSSSSDSSSSTDSDSSSTSSSSSNPRSSNLSRHVSSSEVAAERRRLIGPSAGPPQDTSMLPKKLGSPGDEAQLDSSKSSPEQIDSKSGHEPKSYGLILLKPKDESRTVCAPPKTKPLEKPAPYQRAPKRKLTADEMERKRAEMEENARWRDDQRRGNVEQFDRERREEDKKEEAARESTAAKNALTEGPDFVRTMVSDHAEGSSVEDRIRRNKFKIQRSHAAMDRNFSKK